LYSNIEELDKVTLHRVRGGVNAQTVLGDQALAQMQQAYIAILDDHQRLVDAIDMRDAGIKVPAGMGLPATELGPAARPKKFVGPPYEPTIPQ
jgi:hypothetical protein